VEIVGIVTSLSFKLKRIVFTLCDGTGSIRCEHFRFQDFDISPYRSIRVGSLLSVRGMMAYVELDDDSSRFLINVKALKLEEDPNVELYHWARVMELEETVYKLPFRIPQTLKRSVDIQRILTIPCGTPDTVKQTLHWCRCLSSFTHYDIDGSLRERVLQALLSEAIPFANLRSLLLVHDII
jgi:hypothetical protein